MMCLTRWKDMAEASSKVASWENVGGEGVRAHDCKAGAVLTHDRVYIETRSRAIHGRAFVLPPSLATATPS